MNDAVYIDLFPYDGVSQHKLLRKLQGLESYLLCKLLLLRCRFDLAGESRLRKLIYGAMTLVSRVQSLESLRKTMLRVRNRYNNGKATHVVCMCSCYSFERECVPSQMLADTVSHKFENGSFSIPREYDRFLRQIYGDYMQLPPEDQRVGRHEIQGLDMGEYAIRYGGEK
jgi:lipopolysaccharide cholinephosphotransferase